MSKSKSKAKVMQTSELKTHWLNAEIKELYEASGLTMKDFCKQKLGGVKYFSLWRWMHTPTQPRGEPIQRVLTNLWNELQESKAKAKAEVK